jgi:hypothetical protein
MGFGNIKYLSCLKADTDESINLSKSLNDCEKADKENVLKSSRRKNGKRIVLLLWLVE